MIDKNIIVHLDGVERFLYDGSGVQPEGLYWMWESVNPFVATMLFVTEDGTIQTPTLLKGRTVLVEYTYEGK